MEIGPKRAGVFWGKALSEKQSSKPTKKNRQDFDCEFIPLTFPLLRLAWPYILSSHPNQLSEGRMILLFAW